MATINKVPPHQLHCGINRWSLYYPGSFIWKRIVGTNHTNTLCPMDTQDFCRGAEIFMDNPFYNQRESVEINQEKYPNNLQMTTHLIWPFHKPSSVVLAVCVLSVLHLSCILPQLQCFTTQSEKHWEKGDRIPGNLPQLKINLFQND